LTVKSKDKLKKNLKEGNDFYDSMPVNQITVGLSVILSTHLYEDQIISGETLRILYIQEYSERNDNGRE